MIEVVDGQRQLKDCKRIVVKIGSSLLTANGQGLDIAAISHWAKQIADLHNAGHEIILVSSGAVAEGMVRMKLTHRPTDLPSLQACAAIGQIISACQPNYKYPKSLASTLIEMAHFQSFFMNNLPSLTDFSATKKNSDISSFLKDLVHRCLQ